MPSSTLSPVEEPAAGVRHHLMCPPTCSTVAYAINPWRDPDAPRDLARSLGGAGRAAEGPAWFEAAGGPECCTLEVRA